MTANLTEIAQGTGIFDFSITGRALIVDDPSGSIGQCDGKIVFVRHPSPDIYLIMKECVGVVSETGGMVCHLAIIGMEMGVPTIVGAKDALSVVKSGDHVKIESSTREGKVYAVG